MKIFGGNKSRRSFEKYSQVSVISIPFELHPSGIKLDDVYDKPLNELDKDSVTKTKRTPKKKYKSTQTDFRDSETQTLPWEASYLIRSGIEENCPVLQLRNLTWGNGLPAGIREIEMINAAQMKNEWMEKIPPMNSSYNLKLASRILAALETMDWAFREKEIQCILDIRMKLYKKLFDKKNIDSEKRIDTRMNNLNGKLNYQRNIILHKIRHKFNRELRKLNKRYKNSSNIHRTTKNDVKTLNFMKPDFIDTKNSPRNSTLNIDDNYYETSNFPLNNDTTPVKQKRKPDHLCIKYTKWNEEKLKELYEDLKNIRLKVNRSNVTSDTNLLKLKFASISSILQAKANSSFEIEDDFENSTFRVTDEAAQNRVTQQQDNYQIITDELKSLYDLDAGSSISNGKEGTVAGNLELDERDTVRKVEQVQKIVDSLEERTVSNMMEFLNKELIRLDDERRAHAYVLLATKTRQMKESIEDNEREILLRYQEELDRIFQEIMEIEKGSIEDFLEKTITEGVASASKDELQRCILNMSDKIDDVKHYLADKFEKVRENIFSEIMVYSASSDGATAEEDAKIDNVFDLLKNDHGEHESSFTEEYMSSTSRDDTLDESSGTWETFEETFDEINETNEIVNGILGDILSRVERTGERDLDSEIFRYYYNRLACEDGASVIFEL